MNDKPAPIALIVGGTGDIGRSISRKLGDMGYRLAIAGRNQTSLRAAVDQLSSEGFEIKGFACDITNESDIEHLMTSVSESFGGFDVLVNAAGIGRKEVVLRTRRETWNETLNTNVFGAALLCKSALSVMRRRQSGYIINIGSSAGHAGVAGLAAYSASKAALKAFSDSLREEVLRHGIRVTTVSPSEVDTRIHGAQVQDRQHMIPTTDVAEAVAFLLRLSPKAVVPELLIYTVPS